MNFEIHEFLRNGKKNSNRIPVRRCRDSLTWDTFRPLRVELLVATHWTSRLLCSSPRLDTYAYGSCVRDSFDSFWKRYKTNTKGFEPRTKSPIPERLTNRTYAYDHMQIWFETIKQKIVYCLIVLFNAFLFRVSHQIIFDLGYIRLNGIKIKTLVRLSDYVNLLLRFLLACTSLALRHCSVYYLCLPGMSPRPLEYRWIWKLFPYSTRQLGCITFSSLPKRHKPISISKRKVKNQKSDTNLLWILNACSSSTLQSQTRCTCIWTMPFWINLFGHCHQFPSEACFLSAVE